jgi:pyruvate dehydrogenase E1 component alpha subunit
LLINHTPDTLRAFEAEIAALFNQGAIRAPVHLDGGNEQQLMDIFRDVRSDDWICGSWRQHYHCLLKGVPPDQLKAEILAGRSIELCFPEYRIISSAIAGGILPIALGIAWQIKRDGGKDRVWCFVGDMTARMGIYRECLEYAYGHDLPIVFVQEDNGKSVCTPTGEVWGQYVGAHFLFCNYVRGYHYDATYPHSGAGQRVQW